MKTTKSAFEEPIFMWRGLRIANRRCNNCDFVRGRYTLSESILAIALLESLSIFDSHTNDQMQGVWAEDQGIFF
jgi:hypothetical protein